MKTIFSLFEDYTNAEEAVDALLEEGLDIESLNVIVREEVAKENLDVDLRLVNVQKTDAVGQQTVRGLTQLLGGEQPVHVPDTGDVLAGGELATFVTKEAASSYAPGVALREALRDLGVPKDAAGAYQEGVEGSGVLLWVRSSDERAPAASTILETGNGKLVADYT